MFCWKVVNNALALGKNMSKYVKDTEPYCMMCDNQNVEDEMHLFVNCSFSRKVWQDFTLNNIHLNSGNTNILQWFKTWMNVKSLNEKHNLIFFNLWSIWKYKNNVHFDNVVHDVQKLIDNIRASHLKLSLDRDSKAGHLPMLRSLITTVTTLTVTIMIGLYTLTPLLLKLITLWDMQSLFLIKQGPENIVEQDAAGLPSH
ncbi:uncharacterized protein LOC113272140 [Papaver somniferum]|uniref:uncharacterized protein LOC113272140 n=1 Tax=Papaver somniferum TaxID=3469 RepID=UPI000E6FBF97|nr:uncharacterized protein LOC113272140 [Papaver somniferum]